MAWLSLLSPWAGTVYNHTPQQRQAISITHAVDEQNNDLETKFHGWRLLGVIVIVIVVIAIASAVIDWMVIGPLDGRVG